MVTSAINKIQNLIAAGKLAEAASLCTSLLRDEPHQADILHLQGIIEIRSGQLDRAIQSFTQALQLQPDNLQLRYNLGLSYLRTSQYRRAVSQLQTVVQLNPGMKAVYNDLCLALMKSGDIEHAVETGKQAVALSPNDPAAHYNLALAYDAFKNYDSSLEHYLTASRLLPGNASIQFDLGNAYVGWGQVEKARECFRKVIQLDPRKVSAYANLVRITKYDSPDNEDIHQFEKLLSQDWLTDDHRIAILFAMAKIHQDCGLYKEAFGYYSHGNQLQDAMHPFDIDAFSKYVTANIDFYTSELLNRKKTLGSASETPVFILGTPRSGTTLVEQILSSHPDVFGAGELEWFIRTTNSLPGFLESGDEYPDCVGLLTKEKIDGLAEQYLQYTRSLAGTESRITDKMPENFRHIGLIHILFPNAKIIHCRREPRDACISMFCNYFRAGMSYTYDLFKLGAYYSQYERIMDHWRSVLPAGTMLEVSYEDIVANQEVESRRLLDFVGLQWHQDCLSFYSQSRRVDTPSDVQVTKPIYTSAIARWKSYEEFIQPLEDGFRYRRDAS